MEEADEMTTVGVDVEAVRRLSGELKSRSSELRQVALTLTSVVDATRWVGADRESFVSEWKRTYVNNLRRVADLIDDAARVTDANATEQEAASSAAGGSTGGATTSPRPRRSAGVTPRSPRASRSTCRWAIR